MQQLDELAKQLKNCNKCSGRKNCIAPVGWYGNPTSPLVIFAEAPGRQEDEYGCPLIGKSGQLLNKALQILNVSRKTVVTSNIVKCRPLNNQTPQVEQCSKCANEWLEKELKIINPKIVLALGATAFKYLTGDETIRITKDRGKWYEYEDEYTKYLIIGTFHPSYVLRNGESNPKNQAWLDFLNDVKSAVDQAKLAVPEWNYIQNQPDLFSEFESERKKRTSC